MTRALPWTAIRLALLALATAARAGAEDAPDPHQVPREQFRTQVESIVLRPVSFPPGTPDLAGKRAGFEALMRAELEAHGYKAVPSNEFSDTWKRYSQDLGGVFDPATGDADDDKYKLAWDHTMRELERTRGVDAVLAAGIAMGSIRPGGEQAFPFYWTGVGQRLVWRGEPLRGQWSMPQRVEGPYLIVLIYDRAGVPLFATRVPIQWSRVFVSRGYEALPVSALYGDAARNEQAVKLTLGGLEPRAGSAPAPAAP